MEQDTFITNPGTKKLEIPSINFENTEIKTVNLAQEDAESKNLNISHYKWIALFVFVIILFLLFINGMSVYKSNTFIN